MNDFLEEKQEIIDLRRYKNALDICGKGTMILVLWSLARFLMQITMDDSGIAFIREVYAASGVDDKILYWSVFAFLALIILLIHAFAAFSAVAEARGKMKGYFYLVIYILLIISSCDSLYGFAGGSTYYSLSESVLMIIFEIMSIIIEVGAIVNSIRVKKLKKNVAGEVM